MKKLLTIIAAVAVLSFMVHAQGATADIYGTVVLPDGSAIPGVAVTLTGDVIGKKVQVTSEEGNFRFLNLPPGDYNLKFELEGFKTVLQKNIRLYVGKDKTFNVQMETTKLKEVVEVKGQAGVIDTRKTTVSVNVSKEMIQSLPTARNPWTVMNLVPGMMLDREDVGGNESGQQSNFNGLGSSSDDTTWNVDGANITDPSAIGAAPAYLNVNAYEELQVTLGSNDITAQTGGVQLNFVSKRAGNRYSGDFHLYVEDEAWQLTQDLPKSITDSGLVSPGILRLYQYGVNFGGPIVKDKLWFYGSWAVQDIHSRTIADTEDATWLVSAYGKLNFQAGNTSGNIHYSYDAKKKWNRSILGAASQDSFWNQDGPGAVISGNLQQIMGNLMLNLKFAYTDGGFSLTTTDNVTYDDNGHMVGRDWVYYLRPSAYYGGGMENYFTNRNTLDVSLNGNYFAENVMGGDHEIRFGADYYTGTTTSQSIYPNQRMIFSLDKRSPNTYKEIWWIPDYMYDVGFKRTSVYFSDTATFGKLTANLGIRYDKEQGSHHGATAKALTLNGTPIYTAWLGDKTAVAQTANASFATISPRLSLTYDIGGNGKNVIKASIARYGSQSGNSIASHTWNLAYREIDVHWADDGDGVVEMGEFSQNWGDVSWWTGFNPNDPYGTKSSNKYASDLNSPLLDELSLTFEKALADDFGLNVTVFYKKRHNLIWYKGIMSDGSVETKANWHKAGTYTFADGKTKDWYSRYSVPVASQMGNYSKNYNQYMAAQIILSKKFSNKWMADLSFTYQDWTAKRFTEEYFDLTNYDYFNEGVVAPESTGSGVRGIFVNSRWMLKMNGLYQLPWGINITGVLTAREGYVIPYYENLKRPAGLSWTKMYEPGKKMGDDRLPTFWMLNLGLEKTFKVSGTVTTTIFVDGYNITNNSTTLKVSNTLGTSSTGDILRVLNPGVFQFGIRVNF